MEPDAKPAFAVWITGLPSSGKSTVTATLARQLKARNIDVAVLESDALRKVLTPSPTYAEAERDSFYRAMAYIGKVLVEHGISVIFDATANRRAYRDRARQEISRFVEVYLDSPLELCMRRDPKGIYKKGQGGGTTTVPGLQVAYEAPEHPDVVVRGESDGPETAAQRVIEKLEEKQYL